MTRRALLFPSLLLACSLAFGGFRAWRNWGRDAPGISRGPIRQDPLPQNPLPMDLEPFLPEGPVVLIGGRNGNAAAQKFSESNLYKVYSEYAGTSEEFPTLSNLFGESFLIAVYPAEGAVRPVHFSPADFPSQDSMPQGLGPQIPPVLFLARVKRDFSLRSIFSLAAPYLGNRSRGNSGRETYKGIPLYHLSSVFFMAAFTVEGSLILALSGSSEKIKTAIDLAQKTETAAPASQTPWVKEAFRRIPEDTLLYTLTRDDALKNLNMPLKDIPVFTDWSVTNLAWNGGVRTSGFNHMSQQPQSSPWTILGPGDYDLLRTLPQDSLLTVAANSLTPGILLNFLDNALLKYAGLPEPAKNFIQKYETWLAASLQEEAALTYNGFVKSGNTLEHDAILAVKFKSRARAWISARFAEKFFSKPESGTQFSKRKFEGGEIASLKYPSGKGAEKMIYYALKDVNFFIASRSETLEKILKSQTEITHPPLPAGLELKSNFRVTVDAVSLYKNMLQTVFASSAGFTLSSNLNFPALLDIFSGFKKGGAVFVNTAEGIYSRSFYPYEDPGADAWREKLAPFKSAIARSKRKRR